ncbi:MAG: sodium:alanine symporter family protein [Coriobacteriales bacterium]|nr:sodium:alanine symporter family protein [Coriobacteriales bacterium]
MDALTDLVSTINGYLSNWVLLILLIAMGLFFTIRTKFIQFRCFGEGWRRLFGNFSLHGGKQESGISSFQALATAVAAQVGTGNIVGACGAILLGGPGAIFWMWIIALLGMATNYAEAVLAQKTRVVDADGNVHGGPVYYIKTAFKGSFGSFLAGFFAVSIILSLGFMGCMVQSNSIASTMDTAFGIPTWAMGLVIVLLAGIVFIGGIHRLASVTEKLVPIMAILYIIGSIIVLIMNIGNLPQAFALIFTCAFNPQAQFAGVGFGIIAAITQGAKRGLFSNEAGMGSTPHAHALANVKDPHDQGVVAMTGVFVDTIVVVSMTALVVISVLYCGDGALAQAYAALTPGSNADPAAIAATVSLNKTNMAQAAFASFFGEGFGNAFVAICLLFFAFSTILSWNLFAKLNVEYLFPKNSKTAVLVFSVVALGFIFMGAMLSNDLVWELQDMFNQLMVLPNAIALFALSGIVSQCALAHKGGKNKESK